MMTGKRERQEPIAIVGMGCRFPGGASDPEKFWQLLCRGDNAVVDISSRWWEPRHFYSAAPDKPGRYYAQRAGLLQEDLREFDPLFFGISPREAVSLDPQQRLLLEVSWEALEDAGLQREAVSGTRTGVFIGGCVNDYTGIVATMPEAINNFSVTGSGMTMLAARLSYTYNLTGPSVSLDTACSSSLVAVHYACRSIWQGECDLAFAGGVNVILTPYMFIVMSKG